MYTDSRSVFDDDEVRRAEALSQAVIADHTGNARLIVDAAVKFERYLKEGKSDDAES